MSLVLEFLYGPWDGEVLCEDHLEVCTSADAVNLCRELERGKVGSRIWCPTSYAVNLLSATCDCAVEDFIANGCRFPGHLYEVTEKHVGESGTRIRLQHVGAAE